MELLINYPEVAEVQAEVDSMYTEYFADHFNIVSDLYQRFKSKTHPITDSELESILTELPLELFAVSEELNRIRLSLETIKLKNKESKENIYNSYLAQAVTESSSPSAAKEIATKRTSVALIPYELTVSVHTCLIELVSSKIQFCKELIMGAKKIWDGRRASEQCMPVGEPAALSSDEPSLSKYSVPGTYIR